MKGMISWFAKNHVAANLLMFFLLFAGAYTGINMKKEVFPDAEPDSIRITASYRGASPSEVEEAIIRKIEDSIAGLAGIKRIESTATEGSARIKIEIIKGWDLKRLLEDVKSAVDRISGFPEEAEQPVVAAAIREIMVTIIKIYGDVPEGSLKRAGEMIRDDIMSLPGITKATLRGTRSDEIHIEINEDTLRRYGLTLDQVANAIKYGSMDLPAGSIKTAGREILIRTKGKRYKALDYNDIAITSQTNGNKVTLGQIATMKDEFVEVNSKSRYKGKPSSSVFVYAVADQSALEVSEKINAYVEFIKDSMPEGLAVDVSTDLSIMLKSRLGLLVKNMTFGLILVILILGAFLSIRLSFWVTLGIPISFMTGLWLLPFANVSINMMALFAFIMVLGIVVDDAIIIGESIFQQQELGLKPLPAAIEGALDVGKPVIFAVLTTMVAFLPLLQASGRMGRWMSPLAPVVILVLFGSLIEALFILPAHLANSKGATEVHEKKERFMSRWLRWFIQNPYTWTLSRCLKYRYLVIAVSIAILMLAIGYIKGGKLPFRYWASVEGNTVRCTIAMPAGTPIDRTEEVVNHLERTSLKLIADLDKQRPAGSPSLLRNYDSTIGAKGGRGPGSKYESGGHLAELTLSLIDGEQRPKVTARMITNMWRDKAGVIPDLESIAFSSMWWSPGKPVEVHLSMDDTDTLIEAGDALQEELSKYPGIFDVEDSFLPGKKEMQLKLKPEARSLGLSLNDLARQVRNAFYGAEALSIQRGEDEVKVLVRYPEAKRKSLGSIENMRIRTPDGTAVPFRHVAEVTMSQSYTYIERAQRMRVLKVSADLDKKISSASKVRNDLEENILASLQERYPGLKYAIEGEGSAMKQSQTDMNKAMWIGLLGIYALLAIAFGSFTQPFIVMLAIPFGLLGAALGHIIMGATLSLYSIYGMIGLTGVVVNDSLVLIDATNKIRKKGVTIIDAIKQAGAKRFRAILLTSLTTFGGLTPILLEPSQQAKYLSPMAISLGFGVIFATVITLLLIPCGYVILDDIHSLLYKKNVPEIENPDFSNPNAKIGRV